MAILGVSPIKRAINAVHQFLMQIKQKYDYKNLSLSLSFESTAAQPDRPFES